MKSLGGYWREEYFIYETQNFGIHFLCYIKDAGAIIEYDVGGEVYIQDFNPHPVEERISVECIRCGYKSSKEYASEEWELIKGYKFDEVDENMSVAEFIEERLSTYIHSVFTQEEFVLCTDCIDNLEKRLETVVDSDLKTELTAHKI